MINLDFKTWYILITFRHWINKTELVFYIYKQAIFFTDLDLRGFLVNNIEH